MNRGADQDRGAPHRFLCRKDSLLRIGALPRPSRSNSGAVSGRLLTIDWALTLKTSADGPELNIRSTTSDGLPGTKAELDSG